MKFDRLLPTAFLLLAALLVVGQRFGFRFAGGTGYAPPLSGAVLYTQGGGKIDHAGTERALSESTSVARGEVVSTDAGGYAMIRFPSGTLSLDERTSVEVIGVENGETLALDLKQGRALFTANGARERHGLKPAITFKTGRAASSAYAGSLSVIHYDFLWRADVWPIGSGVDVETPADGLFSTQTAVHVSTDGSAKAVPMAADFDHGPSAAFYAWVQARNAFR